MLKSSCWLGWVLIWMLWGRIYFYVVGKSQLFATYKVKIPISFRAINWRSLISLVSLSWSMCSPAPKPAWASPCPAITFWTRTHVNTSCPQLAGTLTLCSPKFHLTFDWGSLKSRPSQNPYRPSGFGGTRGFQQAGLLDVAYLSEDSPCFCKESSEFPRDWACALGSVAGAQPWPASTVPWDLSYSYHYPPPLSLLPYQPDWDHFTI